MTEINWLYLGVGPVVTGATFVLLALLNRAERAGAPMSGQQHRTPEIAPDPFVHGSARERRSSHRRRGNPVAVFVWDAQGQIEPVRALVLDRSAGGLSLELEEEGNVEPGTVLRVRAVAAPPHGFWVHVVVRNCVLQEDTWRIGCQFTRVPDAGTRLQFG